MSGRRWANWWQDGKPLTGPCMSSVNPGISAAGEAAGRTALDPSSGRAAIGGMLSVGEIPDGETPDTEMPDPANLQTRLSTVVSEITKLADALQGLKIDLANERVALTSVSIRDAVDGEKDSADTAA
jgi:hypothetical protein